MIDYTQLDIAELAADLIGTKDIAGNATERLSQQYAERMDKELHGAWRAGYDYLHVYQEPQTHSLARESLTESFTMSHYVLPSNNDHPTTPDNLQYSYTYDIGSVPDHVIRAAIRGDISDYRTPEYKKVDYE